MKSTIYQGFNDHSFTMKHIMFFFGKIEPELFSCTNICTIFAISPNQQTVIISHCASTSKLVVLACGLTVHHSGSRNEPVNTVLTVQEDVVTLAPDAPQRRIVQAGSADLDGVVDSGLQIQRCPGFSRHRHNLETHKNSRILELNAKAEIFNTNELG